jgi:hypothetical protein
MEDALRWIAIAVGHDMGGDIESPVTQFIHPPDQREALLHALGTVVDAGDEMGMKVDMDGQSFDARRGLFHSLVRLSFR